MDRILATESPEQTQQKNAEYLIFSSCYILVQKTKEILCYSTSGMVWACCPAASQDTPRSILLLLHHYFWFDPPGSIFFFLYKTLQHRYCQAQIIIPFCPSNITQCQKLRVIKEQSVRSHIRIAVKNYFVRRWSTARKIHGMKGTWC